MKQNSLTIARMQSLLGVTVIVILLMASLGYAQNKAPQPPPDPIKSPSRSLQPLETENNVMLAPIKNDSPFGINRHLMDGEDDGGDDNGDDDGDDDNDDQGELEMSFGLDWTSCQWHRVGSDMPVQAVLTGTVNTNHPMVWSLMNGENPNAMLTSLPFVQGVIGGGGADIPLQWDYRLNGGIWTPLLTQPDMGFHIPIPPGNHIIELRVTGDLPYQVDEGYYRLTLNHEMTPQL